MGVDALSIFPHHAFERIVDAFDADLGARLAEDLGAVSKFNYVGDSRVEFGAAADIFDP